MAGFQPLCLCIIDIDFDANGIIAISNAALFAVTCIYCHHVACTGNISMTPSPIVSRASVLIFHVVLNWTICLANR